MSPGKVTLAALKEHIESLRSDFESLSGLERQQRLLSLLQYLQDNEGYFDDDAAPVAQGVIHAAIENLQKAADQAPDCPAHRRLRRQIAVARGDHFLVANEIKTLEEPLPDPDVPLVANAESRCAEILQMVADAFFDSSIRGPSSGTRAYAMRALICESMTDSIAALHLVKHGFTKQAGTLVRSVYESLQLLRLFHEQPKMVDLWVSEPGARAWRELSGLRAESEPGDNDLQPRN